jgi:hypothetical protein
MIIVTGDLLMSKRRTFSREFKLAAVKKVVEKGLSCAEVARDLGIRDNPDPELEKGFSGRCNDLGRTGQLKLYRS